MTTPRPARAEDIRIRPARLEDMDALVALLQELFGIEADFGIDSQKQRRGLGLMLDKNPQRQILVAEADRQVVGMCSCQMLISTAEGAPSGLVEDVVVLPAYRGRGIGRRLVTAITEWAAQQGAARLQLLADRENAPALQFYERQGWHGTKLICLRLAGPLGERLETGATLYA